MYQNKEIRTGDNYYRNKIWAWKRDRNEATNQYQKEPSFIISYLKKSQPPTNQIITKKKKNLIFNPNPNSSWNKQIVPN